MKFAKIAMAAVLGASLAGCQTAQDNPKQTMGTLVGAGLGALAGSQVGGGKGQLAAVAVGTLAGAWMGGEVGKSLDRADRAYMQQTTQSALENNPTGRTSTWTNPDSGHHGRITPVETFQTAAGSDCRKFEQAVFIDGQAETVTGTACRQPDGTWKMVQ